MPAAPLDDLKYSVLQVSIVGVSVKGVKESSGQQGREGGIRNAELGIL